MAHAQKSRDKIDGSLAHSSFARFTRAPAGTLVLFVEYFVGPLATSNFAQITKALMAHAQKSRDKIDGSLAHSSFARMQGHVIGATRAPPANAVPAFVRRLRSPFGETHVRSITPFVRLHSESASRSNARRTSHRAPGAHQAGFFGARRSIRRFRLGGSCVSSSGAA